MRNIQQWIEANTFLSEAQKEQMSLKLTRDLKKIEQRETKREKNKVKYKRVTMGE